MWNVDKYKKILNEIVKRGSFREKPIKSKEVLYRLISKELYSSYETVKSWTRAKSNGSGNAHTLLIGT